MSSWMHLSLIGLYQVQVGWVRGNEKNTFIVIRPVEWQAWFEDDGKKIPKIINVVLPNLKEKKIKIA